MAPGGYVVKNVLRHISLFSSNLNCFIVITLSFLILLPSPALNAWSLFRQKVIESAPFTGTIIDAESRKSIPDAVVVVFWPRLTSTFAGVSPLGTIEVLESVTDAKGHYKIPGWKKKQKDVGKGGFRSSDPEILIYAHGYWPVSRRNTIRDENELAKGQAWKSDWNGKEIELKSINSSLWNNKDLGKYKYSIDRTFNFRYPPECSWIKLPHYYLAKHRIIRKSYLLAYPERYREKLGTDLSYILKEEQSCEVNPVEFFISHGMTNEELKECCSDLPEASARSKKAVKN